MWIITIVVAAVGIGCYYIGRHSVKQEFREAIEGQVLELLEEKMESVRALYDETYRNVLLHLLNIKKELEDKNGQK
jgi:hypothetical protein